MVENWNNSAARSQMQNLTHAVKDCVGGEGKPLVAFMMPVIW